MTEKTEPLKIWKGINFHCFGEEDCPLHDAILASDVKKKFEELSEFSNPCMKCGSVLCAVCWEDIKKIFGEKLLK